MSRVAVAAPAFHLDYTLESGQVFHWQRGGRSWEGLVGRIPLRVEQRGEELLVAERSAAVAREYFALDHPLEEIFATFPDDAFTREAVRVCRGIRILRQPRWECLATFITSSMKQVGHIRAISLVMRERYGERVSGSRVAAYPTVARLAGLSEAELRACGLGFRAKSLLATARMVDEGAVDLEGIAKLPTREARAALCGLPGVGEKIANCVLLFAYERLEAVPVDVWIARVLRAMDGNAGATPGELDRFCRERLGRYAGYVQQYLFHHARISKTLPAS